jgi:hypothetical protein
MVSKRAIDIAGDNFVMVNRDLIHFLGLDAAALLSEIVAWINSYAKAEGDLPEKDRRHFRNGKWWVYNKYDAWTNNLGNPWGYETTKRIVLRLEMLGVLETGNFNTMPGDTTKWYTINVDNLNLMMTVWVENDRPYQNTLDGKAKYAKFVESYQALRATEQIVPPMDRTNCSPRTEQIVPSNTNRILAIENIQKEKQKSIPATPSGVGLLDESDDESANDSSSDLPSKTGQKKMSAEERRRAQLQRNAAISQNNAGKVGVPDFHTSGTSNRLKIEDFGTDSLEAHIAEMLRTEFGRDVKTIAKNHNEDLSKPMRFGPTVEGPSPRQLWQGATQRLYKRFISEVVPRIIRDRAKDKPETVYKLATMATAIQIMTKYHFELKRFFDTNGMSAAIPTADTPQIAKGYDGSWSEFAYKGEDLYDFPEHNDLPSDDDQDELSGLL